MEKLVEDDLLLEVEGLWAEIERMAGKSTPAQILTAIRMVAVGLSAEPPLGAQLKIYQTILSELPWGVLLKTSRQILAEYKYPTFPKPAEWIERAKGSMEVLSKARVLMNIYPGRRRLAFRKYGPRKG